MIDRCLDANWRWALLLGCLAWLFLVASPPLLAAAATPLEALPRLLLSPVCHQLPERSFALSGVAFAACHRCVGLYIGFTLGVALWPRLGTAAAWLAAHPRWIVAFFAPLGVDVLLANTPASRFATGLVAAFPVALLPLLALAERRSIKSVEKAAGGEPPRRSSQEKHSPKEDLQDE